MMSTLEHWAHRLFPKASFDDFIERLEKLGSKKGGTGKVYFPPFLTRVCTMIGL